MYSCHLFLISSASVKSLPFLSFIEPIFAWNVPLVSLTFLKRSLSFPFYCFLLFLCIDHWGRLSYVSLLFFELCILMGIAFLFSFFCIVINFPGWGPYGRGLVLVQFFFPWKCWSLGEERWLSPVWHHTVLRLKYQIKLSYQFYDLLRQLMLLQERNKDSQSIYCEL